MYWLLKLSKTEHERMRHWNLVPLYDAWYQEWYNFLREWTNAREAGGSDDPWNMLERFLGIPSDDMDTGDDTSVEDQLTSTEPEDSGSTRIAPGQALPGASNVDSGPTETTSGA
jgi:hypothetical protein